MEATTAAIREIAVPGSIFTTLRDELSKEAGPLAAIHALHHAGYEAGVTAGTTFGGTDQVGGMSQAAFWKELGDFFSRRGWGTLAPDGEAQSVGLLASPDWVEADPTIGDPEASCSFSTGFLSGLMCSVAGGPVAVLEVECRSRGDARCGFAFGSEASIHSLYGQLVGGTDLDAALSAL